MLKVLNGPLAAQGEHTLRGPVVRLGASPGPGGFKLGGYRGLDARQASITAYTGGSASVAPVGTNQVRLAPHPNVNWGDIDPITGPEYLSPGCAIHLGPVGRGATVEFVQCRRLGQWQEGRLASEMMESTGAPTGGVYAGAMQATRALPAAYDARRVGRIQSSYAPFWFLGCSLVMSTAAAAAIGIGAGGWYFFNRDIRELGPVEEGYEFYKSVDLETTPVDVALLEGLEQPYYKFVMEPNITYAGMEGKGYDNPKTWDNRFFQYVTASVEQHAQSWAFFSRMEAVHVEYAKVVLEARKAGLPEVLAAIPYQESRYNPAMTSVVCAAGYWQFMPEVAHRLETLNGLDFKVANCSFRGAPSVSWSPTGIVVPGNAKENAEYMDNGTCMIDRCLIDDRKELDKSTAAAMFTLKEPFQDPVLAKSLSAVQIAIASHNAGYDDARFSKGRRPFNLKPAYERFVKASGEEAGVLFMGAQIRCRDWKDEGTCDSTLVAETQHYAYSVVAQHILAVCYFAKNYGEEPAFTPWRTYVGSEGYCQKFRIPTKTEVQNRRSNSLRGKDAATGGETEP